MGLPVKVSHWRSDVIGPQVDIHLVVLLLHPPERFDMFSASSRKDEDGYTEMGWQLVSAIDRVSGVEDTNVKRYTIRLELAELIAPEQVITDLQVVLHQVLGPDLAITVIDRETEIAVQRAERRARTAAAARKRAHRRRRGDRGATDDT